MELTNDFEVAVPVEQAWAVLTDVERIAPCLPGAQLQEVEGDEYRGIVKVKVGPITAQYKGAASFVEKDDVNHVAKLKADGRDTRGNGNANALITATLVPAGDGTKVSVVTDLQITGKVAQFGRGVMADVSAKLLDQFVANLHETVLAADGEAAAASEEPVAEASADGASVAEEPTAGQAAAAAALDAREAASSAASEGQTGAAATEAAAEAAAEAPTVRTIDQPAAEPVNLMDAAGAPVLKRLVPTIATLVVLALIFRWLRGRGD